MSRVRVISIIALCLWEFVCLHGLSFWTMRRHNGQIKVFFHKPGLVISLLLSTLIMYCIYCAFLDQIELLVEDFYIEVDQITSLVATVLVFLITPVVFISVWIHHKKLKEVGEKYLQVRGIMVEIGTTFDEYYVQRAICMGIAPVVVAYLGLYSVMTFAFKSATLDPKKQLWDYFVYYVAQLSPIYLIFLSIVKITVTLNVAATRFQGIAKVLEVL